MAEVVPFPVVKRRNYVHRQAVRMAELSPAAAEKHLRVQLSVQTKTMTRKGIAADRIDSELRALETAIRVLLWRVVLTGDSA